MSLVLEKLTWPPKREDMERLYVEQHLSAMKIANVYGLKYANPKTAESTILYHLKRNGIERRDPTEHVRKVTEQMVDDWAKKYQSGESLKQIAGEFVDPVTVWNHLKKRGVALRDKVEAQIAAVTKYERRPFKGDDTERAYLMGLRYGDLNVVRHGRAIRVRVSTTHPAMADLFDSLFSPYGHVSRYPRTAKLTEYEWSLECDLDPTFGFLLRNPSFEYLNTLTSRQFHAFLAGFFDAEGCIRFHKKGRWGGFELSITNMNRELLELSCSRLLKLGYGPFVKRAPQNNNRGVGAGEKYIWRLELYRAEDVRELLCELPLRHSEKIAKAAVAWLLPSRPSPEKLEEVTTKWNDLLSGIRDARNNFVTEAKSLVSRGQGRAPRANTSLIPATCGDMGSK